MSILCGSVDGIRLPGPITATKNRAAMTGMAWIRANFGAVNSKVFGYSIGNNAANSRLTLIGRGAAPGQLQVGGRALDSDPQRTLDSSTTLTFGVWHHVVGIIDYTNSTGAIYIDGALDIAGALSGTFGAATTENTDSLSVGLGVREGTGAGSQGLDGLIEDVRLYSRVLGPAEIATIYASQGHDGIVSGLLQRYPMNDFPPGTAAATTACVSDGEQLVGMAIGSPVYDTSIVAVRRRNLQAGVGR